MASNLASHFKLVYYICIYTVYESHIELVLEVNEQNSYLVVCDTSISKDSL